MPDKVTDLAAYKEARRDKYYDELESAEQLIQITAIQHTDRLIDALSEQEGVTPAFVAEAILMGLLGRAGNAVREHDDPAFCDFLNYTFEAAFDVCDGLEILRDRDDELRQEWRSSLYAHRFADDDDQ